MLGKKDEVLRPLCKMREDRGAQDAGSARMRAARGGPVKQDRGAVERCAGFFWEGRRVVGDGDGSLFGPYIDPFLP